MSRLVTMNRFNSRPLSFCQHGFTLVELTMTMVIIGVLAVSVMPRLFSRTTFESRGFTDQVQASMRYAQKIAIAQHRFVCVQFTANTLALSVNTVATCPGTALASLSGNASYQITAPTGVAFSPVPTAFYFDPLGRPNIATPISVTIVADVARTLIVEAETGYVHP